MTLVFINPGHSYNGQPDAGACYNGKRECDVAAMIGKSLAVALSHYENVQTQVYQQYDDPGLVSKKNNSNAQLMAVTKKANIVKADYFVSIHLNALNAQSKGTETLYLPGSTWGKVMAQSVHAELIKPMNSYIFYDRKIKERGDLAVLKYTNMPAILVEVGFISNPTELNAILANIDTIANRIAMGLANACKFVLKDKPAIPVTVSQVNRYRLEPSSDDKYDLYIEDKLVLKANRYETVVSYMNADHAKSISKKD